MDTITNKIMNKISNYFISDSEDYLKRYKVLNENFTYIGNRSKLLVDLLFSIECSLKAIIFQQSNKDEKETYKDIKTHKIKDLLKHINQDEYLIKFSKFWEENSLDSFEISIRYNLEANIRFRPTGYLDKEYYDTISDFQWLDTIYDEANKLKKYATPKTEFTITSLDKINTEEQVVIQDRITSLNNK